VSYGEAIDRTIQCGNWYLAKGFVPIASCVSHGFPCTPYTEDRDSGVTPASFAARVRRGCCRDGEPSTNIQVATGRSKGLLVVDLDGPRAVTVWGWWCQLRGNPAPTWTVMTPRGGKHLWFRPLPGDSPIPPVELWRDEKGDHDLIEILGDGKLAKAPPSVKIIDGEVRPYTWEVSPRDVPEIAAAPEWLSPFLVARKREIAFVDRPLAPRIHREPGEASWDLDDVDAAIPDKVSLAARYGLRLASSSANSAGWAKCHAVTREDRNPSASIHVETGFYVDHGREESLKFFELIAHLAGLPDWMAAVDRLGEELGVEPWKPEKQEIA
jgi:hypothetical protein